MIDTDFLMYCYKQDSFLNIASLLRLAGFWQVVITVWDWEEGGWGWYLAMELISNLGEGTVTN